jgi:TolB-like protein/Flp pilus assembly protein TadD
MQSSLWQNLKQRKIVQWAIGYLAGAYGLLEVTDILSDNFGWPPFVPRVTAVLLGFGFVAFLVIAWFHGERGQQRIPRSELALLLLIALVGVPVAWWVGATTPQGGRRPAGSGRDDSPTIGQLVDFDSASTANSVAVLPFSNLTGDPQNDYLADGVTEDIIAALGNNRDLRVISRTSVMRYRDTQKTIPQIANELSVGTILEGSVRVQGGQVRIVAQLIDVATDAHIWSDTYDGDLENIFALQTRVAQDVASRLNASASPVLAAATVDSIAYRQFAMGRRFASSNDEADRSRARIYFDSAIAQDPEFARAYEALAELDVPDPIDMMATEPAAERTRTGQAVTSVTTVDARAGAENAAQKALSINPLLSGAQSSLALQQAVRNADIGRATENAMKAVASNPNDVRARSRYAQILAGSGEFEMAMAELDTALARDPFSPRLAAQLGELHFAMGHPQDALVSLRRAIDLDSTNVGARMTLALVLKQHGEIAEALEEIEMADAIAPDHPVILSTHGYLLAEAGRDEEARTIARRLEERARTGRIPGNLVAQVWSAVGDVARAANWLARPEAGSREGERRGDVPRNVHVFVSPTMRYMFTEMRKLPELRSKLDSMGFPVMVVTVDSPRVTTRLRVPPPPDSVPRHR